MDTLTYLNGGSQVYRTLWWKTLFTSENKTPVTKHAQRETPKPCISIFHKCFAGIDKIFILRGGLIMQELSYLPCAFSYRFMFSSKTIYMTLAESEETSPIFLGHCQVAENNPEITRVGKKSQNPCQVNR